MAFENPTAEVIEPSAVPRAVIRVKMAAAGVVFIREDQAQLLNDPSPQENEAFPSSDQ